ncbi:hypothetical protein K449DRAFT_438284 [Hypoxylon sp. EC38]|nr:hypothetical protein K449DRAFT_438284 [Hypoxylon sp. EC38]
MGQSLSKGKRKSKKSSSDDEDQCYVIRHPRWEFQDPESSEFCYSPIRTNERRIPHILITKIENENQRPYYVRRSAMTSSNHVDDEDSSHHLIFGYYA